MVIDRDLLVLLAVAHHFTLTAAQVRQLCFPNDRDGRIARRRLSALVAARLINRTRMEVVNPTKGTSASVYFPARNGLELLAVQTGDDRYRLIASQMPPWQNLRHLTLLSDLRIIIDQAIRQQSLVTMPTWHNEFDMICPNAEKPAEKYRLYTLIAETPKKIVCVPDAAFELKVGPHRKAYYIELETGSNPVQKAASEKTPGYRELYVRRLAQRHFPGVADDFRVLVFAPDGHWRDALRKSFLPKEGSAIFRFAALTDLNANSFLHEPIFYRCDGEPGPLVKRPDTSTPVSGAETSASVSGQASG